MTTKHPAYLTGPFRHALDPATHIPFNRLLIQSCTPSTNYKLSSVQKHMLDRYRHLAQTPLPPPHRQFHSRIQRFYVPRGRMTKDVRYWPFRMGGEHEIPVHIIPNSHPFPFGKTCSDRLAYKIPSNYQSDALSLLSSLHHPNLIPFHLQSKNHHTLLIYHEIPRAWNGQSIRSDLVALGQYLNSRSLCVKWRAENLGIGPAGLRYCLRCEEVGVVRQGRKEVQVEVNDFYSSIQKTVRLKIKKVCKSFQQLQQQNKQNSHISFGKLLQSHRPSPSSQPISYKLPLQNSQINYCQPQHLHLQNITPKEQTSKIPTKKLTLANSLILHDNQPAFTARSNARKRMQHNRMVTGYLSSIQEEQE